MLGEWAEISVTHVLTSWCIQVYCGGVAIFLFDTYTLTIIMKELLISLICDEALINEKVRHTKVAQSKV